MASRLFSSTATDRVQIADHADLDATTAVTVDCWIYWDNAETDQPKHIVSKHLAYKLRISLKVGFTGFNFSIVSGSTDYDAIGGTPVAGRWYHMAGTFDGTTVKVRVYDSTDASVNNYTTARTGSIDSTSNNLFIGTFESFSSSFDLEGRVANVRIWKDIALTDQEVDAIRFHPGLYRSPALWLPLGLASPEPDWSGSGHSGAVTGASVGNGPPIMPYSARNWGSIPLIEVAAGGDIVVLRRRIEAA